MPRGLRAVTWAALLAAPLAPPAQGQGLLGHPHCPCIEPWQLPGGGPPKELTFVDAKTGRGCLRGEGGNCLPLDYGALQCSAWDLTAAPRCADQRGSPYKNAPDQCKQPWCFVGPQCGVPSGTSRVFPGYSLRYSHETCGAIDSFSTELLLSTLKGRVLRAGVPAGSMTILIPKDQDMPVGWSADFMNHLLDEVGAHVELEEISAESLQKFPLSTYSACVHDVALGWKDFCYGGVWETADRLAKAAFSPIYDTVVFYLVVQGDDGAHWWSTIPKAFAPFSLGLWLLLAALALAVGFAMWLFGEVGDTSLFEGVLLGLQMACLKFMGHGGGWDSARTPGGNVLLFGFSFLCMMGLASYTANLSSFLLMANLHTGMQGLQDAVDQGVRICSLQSAVAMFNAAYPQVRSLMVPVENWGPLMDAFRDGRCGAMLMPREQYEAARAAAPPFDKHGSRGHCDLRRVGDALLAIPQAVPLNRDLDHAPSYLFAREKFAGMIDHYKQLYPAPHSVCSGQGGLREGAQPMGVADLLGGFLLAAGLLILAGLVHFCGFRSMPHPPGPALPQHSTGDERRVPQQHPPAVLTRGLGSAVRLAGERPVQVTAACVFVPLLLVCVILIISKFAGA